MDRLRVAGGSLVTALLALGGCADRSIAPVRTNSEVEESATDDAAMRDTLKYAAVFECESGEAIQVRFNHDTETATLKRAAGETLELALQTRAEFETYSNGAISLAVGPGETRFTAAGIETTCRGVSRPVGPPLIDSASVQLRVADDGGVVRLAVGQVFSVSLVGVPTAGYQWSPASQPAFIEIFGTTGGATSTAQFLPGFTGGNHWEVLAFKAVANGSGELILEERRPFEDASEPAADRFSVSVVVQ